MIKVSQQPPQTTALHEEHILVVKREHLLPPQHAWQGIKTDGMTAIADIITKHQEFIPRSSAEQDERYKQIIPYAVFRFEGRYFLTQRKSSASEQRLRNKFSLGIGGHMRQEDMSQNSIFGWAMREFHEEIEYEGTIVPTIIGAINDDSNEVGKVHLGLVLLLEGDSDRITVKSELKDGFLASMEECQVYMPHMETWSATIIKHLQSNAYLG